MVLLAACKQSLTEPSTSTTVENEKATALLNMPDAATQRQAFSLLSAQDKAAVWQQHFVDFVASHTLHEKQLLLIEELKDIAIAENFASEKAAAIVEVKFAKPWMKKAEENFTGKEIMELVLELKPINVTSQTEGKFADEQCQCAVGSKFTCYSATIGIPSGVNVTYQECTLTQACHVVGYDGIGGSGCGFMMMCSCNGNQCGTGTPNPA